MTRDATVLQIVGQIYDAAGSPNDWGVCLAAIRDLLQGTAAHLVHHNYHDCGSAISAAAGLDPAAIHAYLAYYHAVDPWAQNVNLETVLPGQVVLGQSLVSHAEMLKTEYYADLGRHHDVTRCPAGYLEKPSAATIAVISVNRSDRAQEFDSDQTQIMGLLMPHLRRALMLHRRLTDIDTHRAGATEVIDRLSVGVILLDSSLRPVFVNQAAERILVPGDGLVVDAGELHAGTPDVTNALRRMAAEAAAVTTSATIDLAHASVDIPRPSGRRPLHVVMTPVRRDNEYAARVAQAVVAVFITDPDTIAVPNTALLRQLYRFTPTETRVVAALANGQTTDEISASLRVTRPAVGWHIKQALAKTGVSTQAQLVRVVLSASVTYGPKAPPGRGMDSA